MPGIWQTRGSLSPRIVCTLSWSGRRMETTAWMNELCPWGGSPGAPASLQHRFSKATKTDGGRFPLPGSQHQSGLEPGFLPPNPRLFVLEEGRGIREAPLYSPAPAQEMRVRHLSENRRGQSRLCSWKRHGPKPCPSQRAFLLGSPAFLTCPSQWGLGTLSFSLPLGPQAPLLLN